MGRRQRRRDKPDESTAGKGNTDLADWLDSLENYPEAPAMAPRGDAGEMAYPVCGKCKRRHDPWLPDCPT
jgi:hypothetical protein